jgi:hypothetical protein
MVAWLVQRCAVSATTAREWVTAAQKLEVLLEISNALAQGKLSFDQVKPLVEVAKPETDATLAEEATRWSAKQVRELAVADRRQSDDQASSMYARRYLRFNDRRRTISAYLPTDQYAKVKGTLTTLASRHRGDRTPFDQRLADALGQVCEPPGGDGGGAGGDRVRPTVVVHADLTFLAGVGGENGGAGGAGGAELDVLGPVSPEVARRLACDARIIVSGDDAEGRSIQQGGARRHPTPAQRLEIRRRDKGCRFPGCTFTEFTDVHHVEHWTNGGRTDIPNLVTLCDQHHRAVHELGWKMSGDANELLSFRSPTGRVVTSTPSPTFNPARAGPPG